MKDPIFEFPSYRYKVDDWEFKKNGLLNRINKGTFIRTNLQPFETDRDTSGKTYVHYLQDFLRPQLEEFCQEAAVTCSITDAWCVRYQKGDQQTIHNHRGWGFSGVLYLEFDPKIHTSTLFVSPWQDPIVDTAQVNAPQDVKEGTVFIFPSYCLHCVTPSKVSKPRMVISFDLLPEHQSLNRNV